MLTEETLVITCVKILEVHSGKRRKKLLSSCKFLFGIISIAWSFPAIQAETSERRFPVFL